MTDGRRGTTLAARLPRRVRWLLGWLIGGSAAIFAANAFGGAFASLAVTIVLAAIWFALMVDGVLGGWEARGAGLPALLLAFAPLVALPFAFFLSGQALYWSNVAPSWWMLHRDREAFDDAIAGGTPPRGISAVERAGDRTAFHTVNGVLGAWRGIVHDPSGRMAAARGWNGGPVAADIRRVFRNSDTIWCQRITGPWFHCHFD